MRTRLDEVRKWWSTLSHTEKFTRSFSVVGDVHPEGAYITNEVLEEIYLNEVSIALKDPASSLKN